MSDVVVVQTGSFPQTGSGMSRKQLLFDITEYVGGTDRPEVLARAGRALDDAVRRFNSVSWRFNRVTTQITFVAGQKTYTLPTDFRTQQRCQLLDSNGNSVFYLEWVPYERWLIQFYNQTVGAAVPSYYTAMNVHNAGLVRFEPYVIGTPTYPTAEITYLRRIQRIAADTDVLNVPVEVEQAIKEDAAAILVTKTQGGEKAVSVRLEADKMRAAVEAEHRTWGEMTGWGASG